MTRAVAIATLFACAAALPTGAQRGPAPAKPYKPVAVTLPEPPKDRGFAAIRAQLATIAQKRERAALTRLVDKTFFWNATSAAASTPRSRRSTIS